ncbi:MAG: MAPEG family protein [Rhodanobacteraceae bacterium]
MIVTGFYVALLALLSLFLALRVVMRRKHARVGLGHGGDEELSRRQRAHANMLEYVPLALLLLLVLELDHTVPWLLHVFGITLVVARVLHAWGLSHSSGTSFGRLFGTLFTWLVMLAMIAVLLWQQAIAWLVTAS